MDDALKLVLIRAAGFVESALPILVREGNALHAEIMAILQKDAQKPAPPAEEK